LKLPLFVWAIFVTAILLLLSLPVLAGVFYIVPALILAICWKHFFNVIIESQSAGNLFDLSPLRILRDYTPSIINCSFQGIKNITNFIRLPLLPVLPLLPLLVSLRQKVHYGQQNQASFSFVTLLRVHSKNNYLDPLLSPLHMKLNEKHRLQILVLATSRLEKGGWAEPAEPAEPVKLVKVAEPVKLAEPESNKKNKNLNEKFYYYLTGLIEGDGTIIVPNTERSSKGKFKLLSVASCYTTTPAIQISFDSRDFPLALLIQQKLGFGSVSKTKGVNTYRLTIDNSDDLINIVKALNGKFRTVKINDFYLLIDFLNKRFLDLNLIKKELDTSSLKNNY
jgi:hypothetical protein